MKTWHKEMSSNLIAVRMPTDWGRDKGLLGELQDPLIFLARNGAAYNPPAAAPPTHPVIVAGATTVQREQACLTCHRINLLGNRSSWTTHHSQHWRRSTRQLCLHRIGRPRRKTQRCNCSGSIRSCHGPFRTYLTTGDRRESCHLQ